MFIVLLGINHRTAPVEIREKLSISPASLGNALEILRHVPGVEGGVILSTCNRLEIYLASRSVEVGLKAGKEFLGLWLERNALADNGEILGAKELEHVFYTSSCHQAVHHLFRVAAGLDSMVLGETQILGQVKEAYEAALKAQATNGVLNTLFQQALAVGKKVRAETGIDQHAVSIGSVAVELARQVLGSLEGQTILILGAGEMGELVARHLLASGAKTVLVSNRSYERAVEVARRFSGEARRFDDLVASLVDADIVISCTSACHCVVRKEHVATALKIRNNKSLLMIDIAVPRDIDPEVASLPGVYLYDIDDLQTVIDSHFEERKLKAHKAEKIILEELERFNQWLDTLSLVPTIVALKEKAEKIKQEELRRAKNRLGTLSPREEKIIISLANSIVNRLLHDPVIELKSQVNTSHGHLYAEVLKKLFRLEKTADFSQEGIIPSEQPTEQ